MIDAESDYLVANGLSIANCLGGGDNDRTGFLAPAACTNETREGCNGMLRPIGPAIAKAFDFLKCVEFAAMLREIDRIMRDRTPKSPPPIHPAGATLAFIHSLNEGIQSLKQGIH